MNYVQELGPEFQTDFASAMRGCAEALQGRAKNPEAMHRAMIAAGIALDAVVNVGELHYQPDVTFDILAKGLREHAGFEMPAISDPPELIRGMIRLAGASIEGTSTSATTVLHDILHGDNNTVRITR